MKLTIAIGFPIVLLVCYLFKMATHLPSEIPIKESLVSLQEKIELPQDEIFSDAKIAKTISEQNKGNDPVENPDEEAPDENLNLKEEWYETLKAHLTMLDEEKGEELFNLFYEEKVEYERVDKSLMQKEKSLLTYDEIGNILNIRDKHEYRETSNQRDILHQKYISRIKEIFGEYYPSVSALHKSFENSIQAFNKTQTEILVDNSFID